MRKKQQLVVSHTRGRPFKGTEAVYRQTCLGRRLCTTSATMFAVLNRGKSGQLGPFFARNDLLAPKRVDARDANVGCMWMSVRSTDARVVLFVA